jgi:hypothetical protein
MNEIRIRITITITITLRSTSTRRRRKQQVAHLFALVAASRFGPLARRLLVGIGSFF